MDEKEKALLRMLVEGMMLIQSDGMLPRYYAEELFNFAVRIGVLDPNKVGPPR